MSAIKQKAHQLIDQLPETADWDDLARAVEKARHLALVAADADASVPAEKGDWLDLAIGMMKPYTVGKKPLTIEEMNEVIAQAGAEAGMQGLW